MGSFFARETSPQPHLPTQHEKEKREKLEVDLFKKSRDDARTDLREMVPRGGFFFLFPLPNLSRLLLTHPFFPEFFPDFLPFSESPQFCQRKLQKYAPEFPINSRRFLVHFLPFPSLSLQKKNL